MNAALKPQPLSNAIPGMSFRTTSPSRPRATAGSSACAEPSTTWQAMTPRPSRKTRCAVGRCCIPWCWSETTVTQRYRVKPDGMSFATKDGKAWRDATDRR